MTGMEQMMANILKSVIPPDVMQMLNKENVERTLTELKRVKDNYENNISSIQNDLTLIKQRLGINDNGNG